MTYQRLTKSEQLAGVCASRDLFAEKAAYRRRRGAETAAEMHEMIQFEAHTATLDAVAANLRAEMIDAAEEPAR